MASSHKRPPRHFIFQEKNRTSLRSVHSSTFKFVLSEHATSSGQQYRPCVIVFHDGDTGQVKSPFTLDFVSHLILTIKDGPLLHLELHRFLETSSMQECGTRQVSRLHVGTLNIKPTYIH
jgi:hypothetical protein